MEILRAIKENAILVPTIFAKSMLTATLVASSAEALDMINNQTPTVEASTLEQSSPAPYEDNTNWAPLFIVCGLVFGVLVVAAVKISQDD